MTFPSLRTAGPQWYELSPEATEDISHVAEPVAHDDAVARRLRRAGRLDEPPILKWRWRGDTSGPGDVVWTLDGIRLISPRVREILDSHLGPADEIQWLPGVILGAGGSELDYWTPHLPVHHDVLDEDLTDRSPRMGTPGRYVYSSTKLEGHSVTTWCTPDWVVRGRGREVTMPSTTADSILIVTAAVALALRTAEVTGARIEPAPVH